jgi:hypothetical protein
MFTAHYAAGHAPLTPLAQGGRMDRRLFPTMVQRLLVPGTVAAIGAALWFIGSGRRETAPGVAWAPLWPRPDGNVRSYGEVWDHPQLRDPDAG